MLAVKAVSQHANDAPAARTYNDLTAELIDFGLTFTEKGGTQTEDESLCFFEYGELQLPENILSCLPLLDEDEKLGYVFLPADIYNALIEARKQTDKKFYPKIYSSSGEYYFNELPVHLPAYPSENVCHIVVRETKNNRGLLSATAPCGAVHWTTVVENNRIVEKIAVQTDAGAEYHKIP